MDPHRAARRTAAALPLDSLGERLDGDLVVPDDESYARARRVWNGTVNEYPAAVAYCQTTADAVACVEFARGHDLPASVRSGGHSVSGASVVSGGLVVDCSRMEWVRVDPESRTVRVGAGTTWGTVDRATQSFGLATPGGVFSDTGVAGLTLGGGTGYLTPKHGFASDNLRSVDVVTGTGERVTADRTRHDDLFWMARGGGTPGVVTAFEFDLHPLDHDVCYLESWVPGERAPDVLREYRTYQRDAPPEACVSPYYARVPAAEAFPPERRGDLALVVAGVYAGDPDEGRREFERFRGRDDAFAESVAEQSYTELQSMMDDEFPAGRRYYWKSVPVRGLTDDAIAVLQDAATAAPSPLSTVVVWPMHGAVSDAPGSGSPVVGRDAEAVLNVEAAWDDPETTAANVDWVRDTCERLRDAASIPGTLPNFAGGDAGDADDVYAEHADRLRAVRRRYDPDGVLVYERE
jgi:FAD/FMN-containing dehydrogenase